MNIIKLDAIDSTNTFLKSFCKEQQLEDFTTVVAEHQFNGKGQLGSNWESEPGKNLTFSTFVRNSVINYENIFLLNCLVTLSLISVLKKYALPDLKIKWPNDILSANKKIAGILIENTFKSTGQINSVIGIGINVNQLDFEKIPHASSIFNFTKKNINKDVLLKEILVELKTNFDNLNSTNGAEYWEQFHSYLFKFNEISKFKNNTTDCFFEGRIIGVNRNGYLEIEDKFNKILEFGVKEISFIY